jgi:hypothetical protein
MLALQTPNKIHKQTGQTRIELRSCAALNFL